MLYFDDAINGKNDFNIDVAFIDMRRLGLTDKEVGGLIINPNSLGIQCVLAVGGLIQIRYIGEKKIRYICLMVLILILGALTGSRTYLACLLILGVYLLLVSKGGIKAKVKASVIGIFCVLVSVLLLYLIFPTALETFVQRLNVEDITSGRNSLFVVYAEYMFSSPKVFLWGLGSLSLDEKIAKFAIAKNVPHNGIQEICVAWGIPGLIFFAAMISVLIRRSKQENPHQIGLNYLLLIILFAKIMVGQVITSSYTMLSFALIYLSLCQDFSTNRQTEQIKSK
jgi:O-antigen ligase